MKKLFYILSTVIYSTSLCAQNPITPTGFYMSDPSAHQDKDGRVYVYGSRDESSKDYCSKYYDVLSSKDLCTWKVHSNTFSTIAPNDEVPYSDKVLYAPDCIEKNGKYYLYYCLQGGGEDEGVAVSDSPAGQFKNGRAIKGISQIDPSVFIDDDGQAYLSWGQFNAKVAKLKPNMLEIDKSSIHDNVITEEEHFFHEGSQLIKRNGIYYMIYAHIGRRGRPTCIGYATAKSPFGPYKYGGVIVDNYGCDPAVWNNHGSIAEVNGKWYVFYHRSTEACVTMRKACVEPITFNADGSINEAEMTTQGAHGPLDPFKVMDAERACYLTGHVRVHCDEKGNEMLDEVQNGDTAEYKYFDFNRSPKRLHLELTSTEGGVIEVYANNLCRPLLTKIKVPASDGKCRLNLTAEIKTVLKGVHPVFFRFKGPKSDVNLYSIENFRFE